MKLLLKRHEILVMPLKPYDQVESDYIKKKISGGDFQDREFRSYIDTLIYLEEKILNGASGYADSMKLHQTRNRLREEYRLIYREVEPEKYSEKLARETVQAIEETLEPDKFKTQEIIERLENRKDWEKVAGS
ncbi:MAG: hypothetical protein ABEJ98_00115 [Candidatus Nanohaloarchaea archaeon]